jgi:hypothetical protein
VRLIGARTTNKDYLYISELIFRVDHVIALRARFLLPTASNTLISITNSILVGAAVSVLLEGP